MLYFRIQVSVSDWLKKGEGLKEVVLKGIREWVLNHISDYGTFFLSVQCQKTAEGTIPNVK